MKKLAWLLLLPFSFLTAFEFPKEEMDQFQLTCVVPMYALTKAMELAHENHFRYCKILSYEYRGKDHQFNACFEAKSKKGKYLEYKDESLTMGIVGFKGKPNDSLIIDVKDYKDLSEFLNEALDELEDQ